MKSLSNFTLSKSPSLLINVQKKKIKSGMSFLSAILFGLRETISKAKNEIYIPFII